MDYNEIMKRRFDATPAPQPTKDVGKDTEQIVQWLLEIAFFRDFVYRNPQGKKDGKELSDALVIYDDTVIVVQIKAHDSSKPVEEWLQKELPNAMNQLKGSHRMIKERIVTRFENALLKTQIEIDPTKHKWIYGIIILACDTDKIDPLQYINDEDFPACAFQIFSLRDFELVLHRMDTPGDFLSYYDLRFPARNMIKPKLQDEENTMVKIIPLLPSLLGDSLKKLPPEKQRKNLDVWERKLTTDANTLPDYEYSMLIDDIVAKVHDSDTSLYARDEKGSINNQRIAEFFGYITREKRIEIGKMMFDHAKLAMDGKDYYFSHCPRAAKRTFVYLFTSDSRKERSRFLVALVIAAQRKYGFQRVLGIATEPLGKGGRSYDFVLIEKPIPDNLFKDPSILNNLFKRQDAELL